PRPPHPERRASLKSGAPLSSSGAFLLQPHFMNDLLASFSQQLVNGLSLGAIYALIAIGYTMVYGIIGMINFAHGAVYMIGAFISLIGFLICGQLGIGSAPVAIVLVLLLAMA